MNESIDYCNLESCEQEPLAFSGRIQDVGALIATKSDDQAVCYVSENINRWFDVPNDQQELKLTSLFFDNCDYFSHRQRSIFKGKHFLISDVLSNRDIEGDILLTNNGPLNFYEFEPKSGIKPPESRDSSPKFVADGDKLPPDIDIESLLRRIRDLTYYPKIMLYQFLDGDAGEVVAELSDRSLDSYQGLRFPASDIPQIARALYIDNPFRLIFDTRGVTQGIKAILPDAADIPDLSLSTLRSVSPVHIEYLGNMGVRSSASFPVIVMGRLWGLLALHAVEPRAISVSNRIAVASLVEQRLARELMNAQINKDHIRFNKNIGRLERSAEALVAIRQGDSGMKLPQDFFELISCNALIVNVDGKCIYRDKLIDSDEAFAIAEVGRREVSQKVFQTDSLLRFIPQSESLRRRASGMLYCRSGTEGSATKLEIIWLKSEQTYNVDWAGKPTKINHEVNGRERISPRQSFESWNDEVYGQSEAWDASDVMIATKLMLTVASQSSH